MPINESKIDRNSIESEFANLVKSKSTGLRDMPSNVTTMQNEDKYVNGLVKAIYGVDRFNSNIEIERNINEFFADLFDAKNFQFKVLNEQGQTNKEVQQILEKYLAKANFAEVFWQCKVKAGEIGRYALLLGKEKTFDHEYTIPFLIAARIGYVNYSNKKPIKIGIWFDEIPLFAADESIWFKEKVFSLENNKIAIINNYRCTDGKKIDIPEEFQNLKKEESVAYDFLPVSILRNDPFEKPRCARVDKKLQTINSFDEVISVLPYLEKGGVIFDAQGQDKLANIKFMKDLMFNGTVWFNSNEPNSITERVMMYNPSSTMQTMRNTRNDVMKEIRDDLGIPSIDDIKSAQQSEMEVQANMYLSQPTIERERMLSINFLQDMAIKFLNILKDCHLPLKTENTILNKYSFKNWSVEVDINLTTAKNIDLIKKEASKNINTPKEKEGENLNA
jgi:hypothetical protein